MRFQKTRHALIAFMLCVATMTVTASAAKTDASTGETQTAQTTQTTAKTAAAGAVELVKKGDTTYLTLKATGNKVTGYKGITQFPAKSKIYYFFRSKDGAVYVNALITQSGKTYYAQPDATLASGFTKIKDDTYYFHTKRHYMLKGWKNIGGRQYYFNSDGVQQLGLTKIGNHTYYMDPKKNGAKTIGLKKISGRYYYFDERGRMQTGIVEIDGKSYYFNEKGMRQKGLITYKGDLYYFSPAMYKGWHTTVRNRTYYFGADGKAVTGWLTKNNKKYYFNKEGIMQKGWLTDNGKKYYLNPATGVLNTSAELTIDGKKYQFNSDGSLKVTDLPPTKIRVNQDTCVVTIYSGSTPIRAMLCSVGLGGATPNGNFSLGIKRHWHELNGGVYGQYTSAITSSILFHSVYYYRRGDNNSLSTGEYNKLGSPASAGCVRLNCADAYYIYSKCPVGTPVEIGHFGSSGDPLGKPAALRINTSYDPTDPITTD